VVQLLPVVVTVWVCARRVSGCPLLSVYTPKFTWALAVWMYMDMEVMVPVCGARYWLETL
jgi:hypothetical protein